MLHQTRFYLAIISSIAFLLLIQQIFFDVKMKDRVPWHKLLPLSNQKTFSFYNKVRENIVTRKTFHRQNFINGQLGEIGASPLESRKTRHQMTTKPFFFSNQNVYRGEDCMVRANEFGAGKQQLPNSLDQQISDIQRLIRNGCLNITRLASIHLKGHLEAFEHWATEEEPISEVTELADEFMSQVTLINSSKSELQQVGTIVSIRIDVFNSQNVPLLRGGDEVRVWIKDQSKMASMAVEVEDLMNGSYVAHVPLRWVGQSSIFVSLAYPREILRAILYMRTTMRAIRLNAGGFTSLQASEATLCSPFPNSYNHNHNNKNKSEHRGGGGTCNLTLANGGRSWYCDKPTSRFLSCDDWTEFRDLDFPSPLPLAKGERDWFDQVSSGKKNFLRVMVPSVIQLNVTKGKGHFKVPSKRRPPCSTQAARDTWLEPFPRGMIFQMRWVPFRCRLRHINSSLLQQLLSKHTVYMIGDSNLRIWQEVLFKNHVCHIVPVKLDPVTGRQKRWHDPTECVNHQYNFVIKWRTHALPFHTNPTHWAGRGNTKSVADTLDGILPVEKLIVLLHLYIHLSTHHASIYLDRVRAMRDAVARLLRRIPTAKVVIRGPHVAYNQWPAYLGGDAQGPFFRQILIEEFKDLYDKVIFLDFWDMSIAGENKEFHPSVFLTHQMMNVFFSYVLD